VSRLAYAAPRTLALALAFAPGAARADTRTEAGIFAAIVTGSHVGSENPVPVSGVVPGAALEAEERVNRLRIRLEGIPTVGASGSSAGPYGHSSATLSLLNTLVEYDLDERHRFRAGTGFQLVDLANFNGNNGDRNQARIVSYTLAGGATLPLARGHFIDLDLKVDPNLRGNLHVFNEAGQAQADKPEAGAEFDYAVQYGWQRRNVVYRVGARALSYHTRNTSMGELVDRNVGGGVTFDVRYVFGRR
jgi:hypothetical protein